MDGKCTRAFICAGRVFQAAPVRVVEIRKHLPAPHASRQAGGHVLTPGRYVGAEAVEDDGEPFDEKMKRLVAQLREQQAEAACLRRGFGRQAKLDAAIAANLKELGYGG
jgi:glycine/D-amino acid oxidase-like deaminating enzyme